MGRQTLAPTVLSMSGSSFKAVSGYIQQGKEKDELGEPRVAESWQPVNTDCEHTRTHFTIYPLKGEKIFIIRI